MNDTRSLRALRISRRPRTMLCSVMVALHVVLVLQPCGSARSQPAVGAAETLFAQHCAVCHDNAVARAPARASLHAMSPDLIVQALTSGLMTAQGAALSVDQRVAIAEYLTGRKVGSEAVMAGHCTGSDTPSRWTGPDWNGWGANLENWRFQPDPGLDATQLKTLAVRWAFGFPGVVAVYGQPTVFGGLVFVGTQTGRVYAIDARTGCYIWQYGASTGVRSAISIGRIGERTLAFFGDRRGHVYAVDATTGAATWKVTAVAGPAMQVTGAPALFENRLYVPISGGDDSAAVDPHYECCKGRGAIVALDAGTGAKIWTTYSIPDAQPQGRNRIGTQLWGPSGVSVWSSPTIDTRLRRLYVGTGDNHSAPATATSDAVLALSLDTGAIVWTRQLLAGDVGNVACFAPDKANCPTPHGPDADLGASPNLLTLADGCRLLTIGQKSGMLWALDPDDGGRVVWQVRVGRGGLLGGLQWGTATDGKTIYAAVSDVGLVDLVVGRPMELDPSRGGGLHAIAASTGQTVWTALPAQACGGRSNCSPAQSAAVTATPDFVLSGSVDGHLRAYSTADGHVLWDFDTERSFETVNGVPASGGSLDAAGPTVAGGMVFVNSGYGLYGGKAGNVLIALAPRP